jgi:hypothetical protein
VYEAHDTASLFSKKLFSSRKFGANEKLAIYNVTEAAPQFGR